MNDKPSTRRTRTPGFPWSHLPNAVALAALAAIACWGHSTGWRAPRFSELWSRASKSGGGDDWCSTHNVPKSRCAACNPSLSGADPSDWCAEHGVAESKCPFCHPEPLREGVPRDWCSKHGVPESQCTVCHPEVAATEGRTPGEEEPEVEVSAEGEAAPGNSPFCTLHELRVQFASPEAVSRAGIRLEAVEERPFAESISAPGEIDYEEGRIARVSARAPGTAWRVERRLGDRVRRGDLLALVDSFEAGKARAELLLALANREAKDRALRRIVSAAESGVRTKGDLQQAEAELGAARIQVIAAHQALLNLGLAVSLEALESLPEEELAREVRFLGLSDDVRRGLDAETASANLVPLVSPLDGIVVERSVVAGEAVGGPRPLFTVADTSRVAAVLSVRLEDAGRLAVGQPVVFRPDGDLRGAAPGAIAWISTAVDATTRTVQARAHLENPDGRLLARTFGSARIRVRENPKAVALPVEAIQWEGCCHIVFVRRAPDLFQVRKVSLGSRDGPFREVLAGVLPGERVATRGSAVLKSEILKSRLGAGCAGE